MDIMFVDYLTLMLVNAGAGFMILAFYLVAGTREEDQRKWAPALAVPGVISLATGLHMVFTWPLIGPFNIAFGEVSVMFGAVLLGLAWSTARGVSRTPAAIYAFFAGLVVLGIGAKIQEFRLTNSPQMAALAFLCSGLGGMLLAPALGLRKTWLHAVAAFFLICAGLMWFVVGYMSYGMHLKSFKSWKPVISQPKPQEPPASNALRNLDTRPMRIDEPTTTTQPMKKQ